MKLACLRCGTPMEFLMRETFQKGESGAWVGDLNFKLRGGFEMDVYSCTKCGRLEFFLPDDGERVRMTGDVQEDSPEQDFVSVSRHGIPQVRCPACGRVHDFDRPQCPFCRLSYSEE